MCSSDLNGVHAWYTAASGTAGDAISFTQSMTLDASGNLGIGTSSPADKLSVVRSGSYAAVTVGNGTNNSFFGYANVDTNYNTNALAGDAVIRGYNGVSIAGSNGGNGMRLDSFGNLGLGVTPSGWSNYKAIEVGTIGNGIFGQTTAFALTQNAYFNAGYKYAITGQAASYYQQYAGNHEWYTAPSGTAGNAISFTQALTLDASGNLGIGTTSPSYKLHVVGSFAATTKSFVIDHPTKEGMKLRYGSLESPYHGIRLTGEATIKENSVVVDLPEYIHALVKQEGSQVQITNIKHGKVLWVDEIDIENNCFTIAFDRDVNDNKEYSFYWSFTAIRKDVEDMIVEF